MLLLYKGRALKAVGGQLTFPKTYFVTLELASLRGGALLWINYGTPDLGH